jgi:hypothetical protein
MTTQDEREAGAERPDTIPASGATDGIRYILDPLHSQVAAPSETEGRPDVLAEDPSRIDPKVRGISPGSDATGLADLVVDDADAQLPDGTPTVRGGQVAHESKRGAY